MSNVNNFTGSRENDFIYTLPLKRSDFIAALLETSLYHVYQSDDFDCFRSADDPEIKAYVRTSTENTVVTFKSPNDYVDILQRIKTMIHLRKVAEKLNMSLDDLFSEADSNTRAVKLKNKPNTFIVCNEFKLALEVAKVMNPYYSIMLELDDEVRNLIKERKPVAIHVSQHNHDYNVVRILTLDVLRDQLRNEITTLNCDLDLVLTFWK